MHLSVTTCIVNKFPRDAAATGPGTTYSKAPLRPTSDQPWMEINITEREVLRDLTYMEYKKVDLIDIKKGMLITKGKESRVQEVMGKVG